LLLSLRTAATATVVAVVVAYPFAYFLAKKVRRGQAFLVGAVALPFLTSYILRAYAWRTLLGSEGVINSALHGIGIINRPLDWLLYSPTATSIGLLYVYLPLAVLPLYSVLERLPDSLTEAAENLGASGWRVFWHVTLPLSMPGVAVGALFTFVFASGEYVVPTLLGGGKRLVFPEIMVLAVQSRADWPAASAMAIFLMVVTLVLVGVAARFARKAGLQ
jgi:ABC-type spermidine/putrescine transport system permease subunit I